MKRKSIEQKLPDVNVKTPMPKVKPPKNRVELERDDYYENLKIADKKIIDLERRLMIAEEALELIASLLSAYPESVFRPIDLNRIADDYKIPVDRISAEVLRKMVGNWAEHAKKALAAIQGE